MSAKTVFISYRRRDSIYAVDRLDERLKQAFGAQVVFRDVRSIRKGHSFPDDIRAALDQATLGIVVIGPWWLEVDESRGSKRRIDDPGDWVRIEVETLLQRTTSAGATIPVIPVLIGGAETPKPADLPDSLKTLSHRDGLHLRPEPDFEDSVRQLVEHIGGHLGVKPQPFAPRDHGHTDRLPRVSSTRLSVTGKKFVGREQELFVLDEAWGRSAGDKINVVSLIGQGGEGKTAVVLEWYSRRARHGWQGARRVFDWSFYSQGTNAQSSASADDFFNAAFAWIDKTEEVPKDPWTKGGKLAELIAAECTLLVLDGLEPLQQPPGGYGGEFKDPAMKALLRGLALNNPGLCILTSRTDITDLADFEHADGSCLRHPLHSLDPAAARALLRELGVIGLDKEIDEAIECFHRHAYDLNLLGNYLAKCTPDHDIRGWQQKFPLLKEDERIHPVPDAAGKRAGHGRRMQRAYERWLGTDSPATSILRLLGLFDRPVRSDLLDELRAAPVIPGLTDSLVPLPDDEWLAALDQLQQLSLISREPMSFLAETADMGDEVVLSAADVPDQLVEQLLQSDDLPAEMKNLSRTELKQLLAQFMMAEKNKSANKAERARRSVTYAVDCHPLLREHFADELRRQCPDARREGHRRLYEYLCATTPDKPQPTLEDLQPLYQAVAHGCQAGLQQDALYKVYHARIQQLNKNYSAKQLGAFGSDLGAVACFFDTPWSHISPALTEADQAWLLIEAATRLRTLGRLIEALEPMRAGVEIVLEQKNWISAAAAAGNLSELELTLGDVARAMSEAEKALTYADRSHDAFERIKQRVKQADAQYQAGRPSEAEERFCEAEVMQKERQPKYPLLYSLAGFRYCDLLLRQSELAAWQPVQKSGGRTQSTKLTEACNVVSQRAAQTLKWAEQNKLSLLSVALDHLTLSRAAFYMALLENGNPIAPPTQNKKKWQDAAAHLSAAMEGLRRGSRSDYLPAAICTRAWMRFVTGKQTGPESAQTDLDEAWEIAERGPMRLFMADIHLYRARLFGGMRGEGGGMKYPWNKNPDGTPRGPKDDLAAARKLIEQCGYWRRKEELEDAEEAAKNW